MSSASATELPVADYRVEVNGTELADEARGDLHAVTVEDDVDAPSMFTLRLVNWDMNRLAFTWSDHELFAEGGEVAVRMGYVDRLETLMTGEITGLEPEFVADQVPMLTVRGYDRRHRLLRGRRTRSFTQVKDSDVASEVAAGAGLKAEVEDTGVVIDYLLQHNQSDLAFLEERARRIGYEVVVDDKTLLFRPRQNATAEVLTLTPNDGLLEFSPRLSTVGQVGRVAVRGWSPKDKEAVVGEAAAGAERTTMAGATAGPAAAGQVFGEVEEVSVDRPVFSQAEADLAALGGLRERALAFVTGEGLALGRTDLKAGKVIRIDGMGRRFSGLYYVTSARHSYSPRRGYLTAFTVRRNAT